MSFGNAGTIEFFLLCLSRLLGLPFGQVVATRLKTIPRLFHLYGPFSRTSCYTEASLSLFCHNWTRLDSVNNVQNVSERIRDNLRQCLTTLFMRMLGPPQ
jgi:hypothetical protein